jgi:hypothetical protein
MSAVLKKYQLLRLSRAAVAHVEQIDQAYPYTNVQKESIDKDQKR